MHRACIWLHIPHIAVYAGSGWAGCLARIPGYCPGGGNPGELGPVILHPVGCIQDTEYTIQDTGYRIQENTADKHAGIEVYRIQTYSSQPGGPSKEGPADIVVYVDSVCTQVRGWPIRAIYTSFTNVCFIGRFPQ